MMATTEQMTKATQKIEIILRMMFCVAIKRIMNAKSMAIAIPEMAEVKNAFSVGIQSQAWGEVCLKDLRPSGAIFLYSSTKV